MKPRISQLAQSGATNGQVVTWNDALGIWVASAPAAGGSAHAIADEGAALTQRPTLDFTGTGVTVTDDAANNKTVVTVAGGSSSSSGWDLILEDAGTSLTNWTVLSGTWSADAGGYLKQTNATGAYYAISYNTALPIGPGLMVEGEMAHSGNGATSGATGVIRGMFAPTSDGTISSSFHHPLGGMDKGAGGQLQRGNQVAWGAAHALVAAGVWTKYRLYVLGNLYTLYANGVPLQTRLINNLADVKSDRLMLVTYAGEARFRNIKVYRMAGPA